MEVSCSHEATSRSERRNHRPRKGGAGTRQTLGGSGGSGGLRGSPPGRARPKGSKVYRLRPRGHAHRPGACPSFRLRFDRRGPRPPARRQTIGGLAREKPRRGKTQQAARRAGLSSHLRLPGCESSQAAGSPGRGGRLASSSRPFPAPSKAPRISSGRFGQPKATRAPAGWREAGCVCSRGRSFGSAPTARPFIISRLFLSARRSWP